MYAVLGAEGNIGKLVVKELQQRGLQVRSISRQPDHSQPDLHKADMLKIEETVRALEGCSHVFLVLGLPYKTITWQEQWPTIMSNVITAAQKTGSRIIFFDNIYMYGPAPLHVPITEDHPQQPPSAKGAVRKQIADMLLKAHDGGHVKAVIARSADFYGPDAHNGLLNITIIKRMLAGKQPQWLGNPATKHTFAYAPDVARATVILGLDNNSYGRAWHLPVAMPPMTINEIVDYLNQQLGTNLELSVPPKALLPIMGTFVPVVKEAAEMMYQSEYDYILSCAAFLRAYPNFQVTDYRQGLRIALKK